MRPIDPRSRPRILLTGFGPFPGVPRNVSASVATETARLARQRHGGIEVLTAELPTEWRAGTRLLDLVLADVQPVLSLHFGVSRRATGLVIETRARNVAEALDASGCAPGEACLDPAGPEQRAVTIPTGRVVARLGATRVPALLSSDAGRYLCNAVLYRALGFHADGGGGGRAGFVHLPVDLGLSRWPRLPARQRVPLDFASAVAGAGIVLDASLSALHRR